MPVNETVAVVKQDTGGRNVWQYEGEVLRRSARGILLQARFDRDDRLFHGVWLCKGDRFVEAYFTHRWYNIFEIHHREGDALKGWYCNITRPARLLDGRVEYVDLALDLLVYPDGSTLLLDEDEFAALPIAEDERRRARQALRSLRRWFATHQPFDLSEQFERLLR
ncbi:MAG: hypothetical protein KatS3mg045_0323 [Bellilinea sp.]|nr:MAG: hypothetical protein KatS3mg045_0323 [Bellilinea sp.]